MSAPSPLPYRLGQRRADVARERARIRREARARARRLPVYPESQIEQQLAPGPRFWRGIGYALAIEAAFVAGGIAAYHWLRWWL